jgi:hypothetical protein
MLGLLVSEFVNMVEAHHGASIADAILFGTEVPDGHDDRLDFYPAPQLQVLIDALARRVGQSPCDLLQSLASRVISRIRLVNPEVFARHADLFGQLASSQDVLLSSYEVDEVDVEEIELLLGERAAAECLVQGLLCDLGRYRQARTASPRLHQGRAALTRVRQLMR